jgi:hypothetical protein
LISRRANATIQLNPPRDIPAMTTRQLFACLAFFAIALELRADPPVASYIFPAGGRRGATVDVKVGGLNLNSRCGFEMLGLGVDADREFKRSGTRWFEGPMLPLPESQQVEDYPKDMAGRVRIAADAPLGLRAARLWTAQGASSGIAFVVGDLPEIIEQESDGQRAATNVTLPVTINGRIFPREDVDEWSFTAKKGEVINAEVLAGSFGSPLEPRLEVVDMNRRLIAESDARGGDVDGRLQFTVTADGEYRVRIFDARFQGGPQYVYRLSLTRGAPAEPADTPKTDKPLALPATIRGRIAKPGQVDAWAVTMKKGQACDIDVKARRAHSSLLPLVVVRDAAGKEVARFDSALQNGDPALHVQAPADGNFTVNISERFRNRAGPTFRYEMTTAVSPTRPDFHLRIEPPPGNPPQPADMIAVGRGGKAKIVVSAQRLGDFKGPIDVFVDGLPAGVTAARAVLQGSSVDIPLAATADCKIDASRLTVRGTAKIGEEVETRVATASLLKGSVEVDSVLLAVTIPTPFVVKADYLLTQAPRGTVFSRHYKIERNGFTGPITVSLADRQARHLQGASGPTFVVPSEKSEFDYPLTMPPWMETGRTCRACIMAVGEVKDRDGRTHEVSFSSQEQNMQIIVVVEPGRLGLELGRTSLRAAPGGEATLAFTVQRGEGLSGPAKVEVLPAAGVSAEPVTVAGDKNDGVLRLRFAKERPPGAATIRATIIDRGQPVVAEASVEIVPGEPRP